MWFVKKTVKEQISKELVNAQIRWEREKLSELAEYRKIWDEAKRKDIQDLHKKYNDVLEEKNAIIAKLYKRIEDQKKAFKKFKELAIQNEILSTELATESESFLNLASKVVGSFSRLQYRAETISKQVEKKEKKDVIIQNLEHDDVELDVLRNSTHDITAEYFETK